MSLNPIQWKRNYRIALVVAALIGFALGTVVGFFADRLQGQTFWGWIEGPGYAGYGTFGFFAGGYWWGAMGAVIGAAFVYMRQLLRS